MTIDPERFYEEAELILMDQDEVIFSNCPVVVQSGRRYFWGTDILAYLGNESAQMELKRITKTIHKGK